MAALNSAELQSCEAPKAQEFMGEEALRGLGNYALPVAVTVSEPALSEGVYTKFYNPDDPASCCEVIVKSSVTLEDYERITPAEDMERLKQYAEEMRDKRVVRINATAAGGGVAIMNAPWVHLMNLVGVDAHWHAMKPDPKAAEVTKWSFHNVMQNVEGSIPLNEQGMKVYEEWGKENAELLKEPLQKANVIILDDWQTASLIPYIKGYEEETPDGPVYHLGINPTAKLFFRNHIHTEGQLMGTEGTPQYTTWKYLWERNRIKEADMFIVHPKDEFVPPGVPREKVVFMPATCDLLDDLNRPLDEGERARGLAFINEQLTQTDNQEPLDANRPYLVLIARFDESKGMPLGMESYAKARQQLVQLGVEERVPQFMVVGNGSVDDPSGKPMLEQMLHLRADSYGDIKKDIKIARVPHNDIAINALLKGAMIALQPSTKEGFESRVTEAISQGVPALGSNQGGIPIQIEHNKSGYIIDPYDTDEWARRIVELVMDREKYETLRVSTKELARTKNYAYTTVPQGIRWLWLWNNTGPDIQGNHRWVEDLIDEQTANATSVPAVRL